MKKLMILVVMVAAFVLPTMAQSAQEWQTSTMKGSGSAYSSQVTAVGSSVAATEATTTDSYTPGPGAIRRTGNFDNVPEGGTQENMSPIGDAILPLLLFAATFAGVVYLRRKRQRTLKADN